MNRLGQQVMNLRNKKKMTRKQLARKAGISEKALEEMETGKKIINSGMMNTFSKVLGQSIEDSMMIEDAGEEEQVQRQKVNKVEKSEKTSINPVWNDVLSSVLKTVPIYDYTLSKTINTKQLPVIDHKIEGFSKDKVFYLSVQEDDMLGFRMMKEDIVLSYLTHELTEQGFFLIEHKGKRMIRQVKRLSQNQLLLVSNKGITNTQTVVPQEVKILAKLIRIEINL